MLIIINKETLNFFSTNTCGSKCASFFLLGSSVEWNKYYPLESAIIHIVPNTLYRLRSSIILSNNSVSLSDIPKQSRGTEADIPGIFDRVRSPLKKEALFVLAAKRTDDFNWPFASTSVRISLPGISIYRGISIIPR